jgi:hypothetical protein
MFEELDAPKLPFDQFFLGKRSPFSTSGEKVAVRPDEAFAEGSVLKHPSCIRKKSGERGQHGAVQLSRSAAKEVYGWRHVDSCFRISSTPSTS